MGVVSRGLDNIGTSESWLRGELARRGVRVHGTSRLAIALDRVRELRERSLAGDTFRFTTDEAYEFFADATGADFLSKSIRWAEECGFALPQERWDLLAKGDPILTKPGPDSTARNLTWESVIACLAATFSESVELREPPDVTCLYRNRTFSVSAKVAYRTANLFENIKKGFKQANGTADATLVFVNAVALYPDDTSPQIPEFRLAHARGHRLADAGDLANKTRDAITRWCGSRFEWKGIARRLKEQASQPVGVAFFVPTFTPIDGHAIPNFYTHLPLTWAESGPDYEFTTSFLRACNEVLGFKPRANTATTQGT